MKKETSLFNPNWRAINQYIEKNGTKYLNDELYAFLAKVKAKEDEIWLREQNAEKIRHAKELKALPIGAKVYYKYYTWADMKYGAEVEKVKDARTKMTVKLEGGKYNTYIVPYTMLKSDPITSEEQTLHEVEANLNGRKP